jgi:hypothetical protein
MDKKKVVRILLTRLLFLPNFWVEKDNSFSRRTFEDQFRTLYKGITGEVFVPEAEYECKETVRILWSHKSLHILLLHLDDNWNHGIRTDPYYELVSYFDTFPRILRSLSQDEQIKLILEVNSYAQFRNTTPALRKLL